MLNSMSTCTPIDMASKSSKALPYLGLLIGVMAVAVTFAGYGSELDKAVVAIQAIAPVIFPSSFVVTIGGLINKALETRKAVIEATSVKEATDHILAEIKASKST